MAKNSIAFYADEVAATTAASTTATTEVFAPKSGSKSLKVFFDNVAKLPDSEQKTELKQMALDMDASYQAAVDALSKLIDEVSNAKTLEELNKIDPKIKATNDQLVKPVGAALAAAAKVFAENGDFQADALAGLKTAVAAAKEAADKAGDITADESTPTTPAASAEEKFAKAFADEYKKISPAIEKFKAAKAAYVAAKDDALGEKSKDFLQKAEDLQNVIVAVGKTVAAAQKDAFILAANKMAPELFTFEIGGYKFVPKTAADATHGFIKDNSGVAAITDTNFIGFTTTAKSLGYDSVIASNGAEMGITEVTMNPSLAMLASAQLDTSKLADAFKDGSANVIYTTDKYEIEFTSSSKELKISTLDKDGNADVELLKGTLAAGAFVDFASDAALKNITTPAAMLKYFESKEATSVNINTNKTVTFNTIDGSADKQLQIDGIDSALDLGAFSDYTHVKLTQYQPANSTLTTNADPAAAKKITLDEGKKYDINIDVKELAGSASGTDVKSSKAHVIALDGFNKDDKLTIKITDGINFNSKAIAADNTNMDSVVKLTVDNGLGVKTDSSIFVGLDDKGKFYFADAASNESWKEYDFAKVASHGDKFSWQSSQATNDLLAAVLTVVDGANDADYKNKISTLVIGEDLYILGAGAKNKQDSTNYSGDEVAIKLVGMASAHVALNDAKDSLVIDYSAQA